MIIRLSSRTGPVPYEFADIAPSLVHEGGQTLICFSLENAISGATASLMLRPDEIERMREAMRQQKTRRG